MSITDERTLDDALAEAQSWHDRADRESDAAKYWEREARVARGERVALLALVKALLESTADHPPAVTAALATLPEYVRFDLENAGIAVATR